MAREQGLRYAWADIDKTSSAELSEAINAMCAWYEHAAVCFAYLVDLLSYRAMRPLSLVLTMARRGILGMKCSKDAGG